MQHGGDAFRGWTLQAWHDQNHKENVNNNVEEASGHGERREYYNNIAPSPIIFSILIIPKVNPLAVAFTYITGMCETAGELQPAAAETIVSVCVCFFSRLFPRCRPLIKKPKYPIFCSKMTKLRIVLDHIY